MALGRHSYESYNEYKERRRRDDLNIKRKLKPTMIHESTTYYQDTEDNWHMKGITYRKPKDE